MRRLLWISTLCWMSTLQAEPTTFTQAMTSQQLIASGQEAFLKRCSGCHGATAEGNGPAAPMLNPRPRNLVSGYFKFRSTPPGVLPTVSDLLRTIDQGVPGTSMPSFRDVSNQEKLALVAYIRSLRPEFLETRGDQLSLAISPPPKEIFSRKETLIAAAKRGLPIYQRNCRMCHGDGGKGDGPSTEEMVDSDDYPIKPADLTKNTIKSGPTAKDIFKAITLGIEGAPMPTYQQTLTEAERWDLTAYVFYLRGRAAGVYSEEDTLQ